MKPTYDNHCFCLEAELAKQQDELDNVGDFLAIVDRYLEIPELTPEILREFVHHMTALTRKSFTRRKSTSISITLALLNEGHIQRYALHPKSTIHPYSARALIAALCFNKTISF